MDYQATLYDPIYDSIGVPGKVILADGTPFEFTVLDKTTGVDINFGSENSAKQNIQPAAVVRNAELLVSGVLASEFGDTGASIFMDGKNWTIRSYRFRPSPQGEDDGEVYLLLSDGEQSSAAFAGAKRHKIGLAMAAALTVA